MLGFKPTMTHQATQLERGDKYDKSVVHLLQTLGSGPHLVEGTIAGWKVTTGTIVPIPMEPAKSKVPVPKPTVKKKTKAGKK